MRFRIEAARHLSEDDEASLAIAIGSGRQFAERIRIERQRRGWSQAELARRMRDAGQPLDQAAISKIESPPGSDRLRRIDIDEAISFAKVFDLSLEEMTLPQAEMQEREVLYLIAQAEELTQGLTWTEMVFDNAVLAVAFAMTIYPRIDTLVRSKVHETENGVEYFASDSGRGWRFYRDALIASADPRAGIGHARAMNDDPQAAIDDLTRQVVDNLWRVPRASSERRDYDD